MFHSRGRLETNVEQWLRLLHTVEDLLAWILKKQHDLKAQRPVGGDNSSLQKQMEANQVYICCLPLHILYCKNEVLNSNAARIQNILNNQVMLSVFLKVVLSHCMKHYLYFTRYWRFWLEHLYFNYYCLLEIARAAESEAPPGGADFGSWTAVLTRRGRR